MKKRIITMVLAIVVCLSCTLLSGAAAPVERYTVSARNMSYNQDITLASGDTHRVEFDVDGWWFDPDHNSVAIGVTKTAGEKYQFLLENTTNGTTISDFQSYGDTSKSYTNLNPTKKYKLSIVNDSTKELKFNLTISTYY